MDNMPSANLISRYEAALARLGKHPQDQQAQHQAVLTLARMGSLDLAYGEYARYGLDKVRNHEDIMALGGRLSKDLYLGTSGAEALEHARDSAAKYEAAFKDTKGYYSGINAATMALLANMPGDIVQARAVSILNLLPPPEDLTPEDHYFIEATRAECFLLLGEPRNAKKALRSAAAFDPLNYQAHATTLKQFTMILQKRGESSAWLSEFQPPRPAHYGGHIWPHSAPPSEDLNLVVSDLIQQNDIGFGYGALAAGADIIIAEALLLEGAELNVVLPSSPQKFVENSVRPFGEAWVQRFQTCLDLAQSCVCLPDNPEPNPHLQYVLSARMAMGQTIMHGEQLAVRPSQLLIKDPASQSSMTAHHFEDWAKTGFMPLSVNIDTAQNQSSSAPKVDFNDEFSVLVRNSQTQKTQKFPSFEKAIAHIMDNQSGNNVFGMDFDLPGADIKLQTLTCQSLGLIMISEVLAGYAALKHPKDYQVIFAGLAKEGEANPVRAYTLRPKAAF